MTRLVWALVLLACTGCGTVTNVHGWAGGRVLAGVENGQALVHYDAPGTGWTLSVDRAEVDGGTAVLWLTARGPGQGPLETTPVLCTWSPDRTDRAAFRCTQANIRIAHGTQAPGAYLPSAVGCGPLP